MRPRAKPEPIRTGDKPWPRLRSYWRRGSLTGNTPCSPEPGDPFTGSMPGSSRPRPESSARRAVCRPRFLWGWTRFPNGLPRCWPSWEASSGSPRTRPDVGNLLRAQHSGGGVVAGICGGTLALARAGLLDRDAAHLQRRRLPGPKRSGVRGIGLLPPTARRPVRKPRDHRARNRAGQLRGGGVHRRRCGPERRGPVQEDAGGGTRADAAGRAARPADASAGQLAHRPGSPSTTSPAIRSGLSYRPLPGGQRSAKMYYFSTRLTINIVIFKYVLIATHRPKDRPNSKQKIGHIATKNRLENIF